MENWLISSLKQMMRDMVSPALKSQRLTRLHYQILSSERQIARLSQKFPNSFAELFKLASNNSQSKMTAAVIESKIISDEEISFKHTYGIF